METLIKIINFLNPFYKKIRIHIVKPNFDPYFKDSNLTHIPRVGDHIDMGWEPASKVIRVLWSKFPDFNDIYVIVD